jgi:hypothetical protein
VDGSGLGVGGGRGEAEQAIAPRTHRAHFN